MTQHRVPVQMKRIATKGPQCKSKNIQTDISQHLEASSHGKLLLGTPSGMQSCCFLSSRVIAKLVCELYFPPNIVTHASCLFASSDITCSNLHHRLLHKHARTQMLTIHFLHSSNHMFSLTWNSSVHCIL